MFELEDMEPVPQEFLDNCSRDRDGNFNPFHYDLFNMGGPFAKDIFFMRSSLSTDDFDEGYFINVKTGERQRLRRKE